MKKIKKNTENYYIDFLRFIFSFIILFYHSWLFTGNFGNGLFNAGYYGVDFYFIVTGYLMMNSISKKKEGKDTLKSTFQYIYNKIKRLFPSLIVCFLVGIIFAYGRNVLDIRLLLSNRIIGELLQLGIFGYDMTINVSWWYISAMLFVLMFLYPLAKKYKGKYIYYICPLILFITLGLIRKLDININDPLCWTFIFRNGFYKALIFIILGNISFELSKKIQKQKFNKKQKIIITIVETLIYLLLILSMHFDYFGSILMALLFTINIAITFSNQSLTSDLFKSSFWTKLGKFGFYIYLTHMSIRVYLSRHNHYRYRIMLLYFCLISIVVSAFCYFIVEVLFVKLKKKYHRNNCS